MKTIAWNLAHQIHEKPIPDFLADVVCDLKADTVLFNEWVDTDRCEPFKQALRDAGFVHHAVSPTPARHNQIFAASRFAFEVGDLQPPQFDGSAISNFLHLRFPDTGVEVVGMRAPAYKKRADWHAYWDELAAIMNSVRDRPILFAGDVNYDPFKKAKKEGARTVPFHLCDGYEIPNPQGEWSYLHHTGSGSRIDHVIHTPSLAVTEAEYVDQIGGRHLAGSKSLQPISDHAALRFTVNAAV